MHWYVRYELHIAMISITEYDLLKIVQATQKLSPQEQLINLSTLASLPLINTFGLQPC